MYKTAQLYITLKPRDLCSSVVSWDVSGLVRKYLVTCIHCNTLRHLFNRSLISFAQKYGKISAVLQGVKEVGVSKYDAQDELYRYRTPQKFTLLMSER